MAAVPAAAITARRWAGWKCRLHSLPAPPELSLCRRSDRWNPPPPPVWWAAALSEGCTAWPPARSHPGSHWVGPPAIFRRNYLPRRRRRCSSCGGLECRCSARRCPSPMIGRKFRWRRSCFCRRRIGWNGRRAAGCERKSRWRRCRGFCRCRRRSFCRRSRRERAEAGEDGLRTALYTRQSLLSHWDTGRQINQNKSFNFQSCVNNILLLLSFIRPKGGTTS